MAEYIEKQAAIEALGEEPERWTDSDAEVAEWLRWKADVTAIKFVPPADVRPVVRAHWEEYEFMGELAYRCNNCGCMAPASWSLDGSYDLEGRFCNSCGAEMEGGESDG